MLAELDEMVLDELAELFRLRALNHHPEHVCLILKKVAPPGSKHVATYSDSLCFVEALFSDVVPFGVRIS